MSYKTILVERRDGLCLLTINVPATLNALSADVVAELLDVVDKLEQDSSIRVVLITGAGKAFVAGADISYMVNLTADQARKYSGDTSAIYQRIAASSKVFIAVVNGFALGGGCELALACDLRIASEAARFGLPEVTLGILPGAGGTQRLPRLVGAQKAMELILTGEIIKAEEALRIGLVCRVVPASALMDCAESLAGRILKNAPLAVKYARECVRQSEELTLSAGIEYENALFGLCFAAPDQKEGMTAFLEKREARFQNGL